MNTAIAQSICDTLADYRTGEIRGRTLDDVERWLNQFDPPDRPVILAETDRLLKQFYISEERARQFIKAIWNTKGLVGENPKESVKKYKFLDIQTKGSSQKAMLLLVNDSFQSNFGLSLATCGSTPTAYVYLDDGAFSGNRVVHDLKPVIETLSKGTALHFVFLAGHRGAYRYIERALGPAISARGIEHHLWAIHTFENLPWAADDFQLLWPCEIGGDGFIEQYLAQMRASCEGKTFQPRFFRPSPRRREDVFSSPETRQVLESALLRKGAYIIAQCQNPQSSMRPLGYEYLSSLGFGAIVVTYRNIANNCPLALWWGDAEAPSSHPFSKWYPLIPRKGNQVQTRRSLDLDEIEL